MNKLGLHIGYWWGTGLDKDLFKMLDLTHEAGYDVIEMNPAWLLQLNDEECKYMNDKLAEYGMSATLNGGLTAANDISSDDPEVRKVGVDYCIEVLRKMPKLNLKVWSGSNYSEWNRAPKRDGDAMEEKKRALDYCCESMQPIIRVAEELDITYAFEVLNRFEQFMFNTSVEAVTFAERVGSPNCKVLLDAYHMNIEEDRTDMAIRYAAEHGKLGHFHAGESNRRLPGVGPTDMNWDHIVRTLISCGYEGVMVMEPFTLVTAHNMKNTRTWRTTSETTDINSLSFDARMAQKYFRNLLINNQDAAPKK